MRPRAVRSNASATDGLGPPRRRCPATRGPRRARPSRPSASRQRCRTPPSSLAPYHVPGFPTTATSPAAQLSPNARPRTADTQAADTSAPDRGVTRASATPLACPPGLPRSSASRCVTQKVVKSARPAAIRPARTVSMLSAPAGRSGRFARQVDRICMPNSGRCVLVYLCADLHVANGGGDRQFSFVVRIWTGRSPIRNVY